MARGWESKSVESQMEAAEARGRGQQQPRLSAAQIERKARHDSLLLDRKRVLHDLEKARHPRHQQMLREALAYLDRKLAGLGPDPVS
ncbi:MAG: hypothetical protein HY235_24395 [Acidobacteria bacterium]|nr:hypothetical protein [Acidobacteriota bacterium]